MSLVGTWQETKDGILVEVTEEKDDHIIGTRIRYEEALPVRYGEEISVKRSDLIDDFEQASTDHIDLNHYLDGWESRMVQL